MVGKRGARHKREHVRLEICAIVIILIGGIFLVDLDRETDFGGQATEGLLLEESVGSPYGVGTYSSGVYNVGEKAVIPIDDVTTTCEEDDDCESESCDEYYLDSDEDGFGSAEGAVSRCGEPEGYSSEVGDCDDSAAEVNPDAEDSTCDGVDSNCDGDVDESVEDELEDVEGIQQETMCAVENEIGSCTGHSYDTCPQEEGETWIPSGSCDARTPSADVCDGEDNDCNDETEDGGGENASMSDLHRGVCNESIKMCEDGAWKEPDYSIIEGYEVTELSCDDGRDNDCDGLVDLDDSEDCEQETDGKIDNATTPCLVDDDCVSGACSEYYLDSDEDGFGDSSVVVRRCMEPEGYVTNADDCNDVMSDVNPDAEDSTCDGIDSNCDGDVDESVEDEQEDVEGIQRENECSTSSEFGVCGGKSYDTCPQVEGETWFVSEDCDAKTPSNEVCDGEDNDCNNSTEDGSGVTPPPGKLQQGVCSGFSQTCEDGSWKEVSYGSIEEYEFENETLCEDELDNDCDGLADEEDSDCIAVFGDATDIQQEGLEDIEVRIDGESFSRMHKEKKIVSIRARKKGLNGGDGNDVLAPVIEFAFDFKNKKLNLSKIGIDRQNDSLVVDVHEALLGEDEDINHNKTLFFDDVGYGTLCVRDAPTLSEDDISDSCTGEDEVNVISCSLSNETVEFDHVRCVYTNGTFVISGLHYSGVKGVQQGISTGSNPGGSESSSSGSSSSGSSSGGSGSSGGGGGRGAFFVCNHAWECGEWSSCERGYEVRECSFEKKPQSVQSVECDDEKKRPAIHRRCTQETQSETEEDTEVFDEAVQENESEESVVEEIEEDPFEENVREIEDKGSRPVSFVMIGIVLGVLAFGFVLVHHAIHKPRRVDAIHELIAQGLHEHDRSALIALYKEIQGKYNELSNREKAAVHDTIAHFYEEVFTKRTGKR